LTTSLTKRRLTQKALADIEESKAAIAEYKPTPGPDGRRKSKTWTC